MKTPSQIPRLYEQSASIGASLPQPEAALEGPCTKEASRERNWMGRYGGCRVQSPPGIPGRPGLVLAPPSTLQQHHLTAGQRRHGHWVEKSRALLARRITTKSSSSCHGNPSHMDKENPGCSCHPNKHQHVTRKEGSEDESDDSAMDDEDYSGEEGCDSVEGEGRRRRWRRKKKKKKKGGKKKEPAVVIDPALLITSADELEQLAEELGVTHPSLECMARSIFHPNDPADGEHIFDGDGEMRPGDVMDPWTDGCDSENTVLNHLFEKLSYQPGLNHKVLNRALQTKTAFSVIDCGKALDGGSLSHVLLHSEDQRHRTHPFPPPLLPFCLRRESVYY